MPFFAGLLGGAGDVGMQYLRQQPQREQNKILAVDADTRRRRQDMDEEYWLGGGGRQMGTTGGGTGGRPMGGGARVTDPLQGLQVSNPGAGGMDIGPARQNQMIGDINTAPLGRPSFTDAPHFRDVPKQKSEYLQNKSRRAGRARADVEANRMAQQLDLGETFARVSDPMRKGAHSKAKLEGLNTEFQKFHQSLQAQRAAHARQGLPDPASDPGVQQKMAEYKQAVAEAEAEYLEDQTELQRHRAYIGEANPNMSPEQKQAWTSYFEGDEGDRYAAQHYLKGQPGVRGLRHPSQRR